MEIIGHAACDDKPEMVTEAILRFLGEGADLVLCTGGMSVDPDDRTPLAIKIPAHGSYPMELRCFREPCFCFLIWKKVRQSWDFRAA